MNTILNRLYDERRHMIDYMYHLINDPDETERIEIGEKLAVCNAHIAYWETKLGIHE